MIKAAILDMDGTMIDTEKIYMRFWIEAANYYGYDMKPEHVLEIRSLAAVYAKEKFKKFFGEDCCYEKIREKRKALMAPYFEEHGIEKKEGLDELLAYLKNKGYKICVATATDVKRTSKYLRELNIDKYFDEIVCADMVRCGKPNPDIYLEAVRRLGVKSDECIAIEDAPNGVLAASKAGCKVIMVPDLDEPSNEISELLYAKVDNLKEACKYFN
ncbi:MAG: HAD family phosphatase [Lachnospiraceae bacterium]|nr:HAD family phosphatase [Lachnospiraceae bacterium]